MYNVFETDYLVIGTGIAGLTFALKAAEKGSVTLLSKDALIETNTNLAQGGIAAVSTRSDTPEKHFKDTISAGRGLSDPNVVKAVVSEGPRLINELINWGVSFDKNPDGTFNLAREGGHSESRIFHYKDKTGAEVQRALISRIKQHPKIKVLENTFAIDLITQHHLGEEVNRRKKNIECYGAYALDIKTSHIFHILSKVTMLATGGIGNLYLATTNPPIATGDGIAMVYRAKGFVENMEFVQFHPTSLYNPSERPSFLITEAMRGHGAILKTKDGQEFMHQYDPLGSMAPRDIVARAIDHEMKKSGDDFVYLHAEHLDAQSIRDYFPNIYNKCQSLNIDITSQPIPVVPAAHYICGGIKVDINGCTNISRLYAAGECASTGLHGANRLASNSLVEALVFADHASIHAALHIEDFRIRNEVPFWNEHGVTNPREKIFISQNMREIQQLMTNYVGIVRSDGRLERALNRMHIIYEETEYFYKKSKLSQKICELRNMINVGYLIIKAAQSRKESIGLHYNVNYPEKQKNEN
ncbi:MAG: L-aspartate oxidase [Bacteroidetes bacterium HGW-Bacteroidetes-21]|jgi:L-aspartate oxidase|nr:MAG: L-aspartate oxidase [Bacteroidetes bacterium HGW-Bacteroidetes-21]